ncbi:MAG TPA: enoyl-CoA hydratase/isomerase family protein [Saprospiraceae bacterium]|nr:enoyl-CoA hydratase/isomerase family protein [Saprospiraceae bacterium]MCB9328860.1 enoyl-CoA hydratase/isomerase family protein [Lewinellaceae bacterium]HPQ20344.1 enoyl-CoA hydratase/isomerase family protein [Saprospiraceae bacterium]HRX28450.1 enoyl-CoA hydratase/isomerase family protein [Saprospiraceae bacterium]
MEGHIHVENKSGITTISFYHPAHNSLPGYLLRELKIEILRAGNDPLTTIIVLKSDGDRSFCAGASFTELVSIENESQGFEFFSGFSGVINAIRTCGKIVIGRVQGKAVGGGVGLASACDYCMATKYASVRLSELAVGIGPFVIGPAVERKVGLSAFSQMALNPDEWQTAQWAKNKGLFTEAFESTEQLDAYLEHFCKKLVKMNPEALSLLKKVFWDGTENWDSLLAERARMSGKLILSDFAKNAIKGFLQS